MTAAVDLCRLIELLRNALEGLYEEEDEESAAEEPWKDECDTGIDQVQLLQDDVLRYDHDLRRDHHGDEHAAEQETGEAELDAGECIRREYRCEDAACGTDQGDEGGVCKEGQQTYTCDALPCAEVVGRRIKLDRDQGIGVQEHGVVALQ